MKILRLQPLSDNPNRYNYNINYGIWDEIAKTQNVETRILESFDGNTSGYDFVFLPMFKRWADYSLLDKIKNQKAKTILFDNDSCYRSFSDPFYEGIDFAFYRMVDIDEKPPIYQKSKRILFSVDENIYRPYYGGSGISFNCTIASQYPMREEIAKHIKPTNHKGQDYIRHLQRSSAGIHIRSGVTKVAFGKMAEFAACGCEIITSQCEGLNDYYPDELLTIFDTVEQLLHIVKNHIPNIEIQKELRHQFEMLHSNRVRAEEVLRVLEGI